jgi:hypothetical protein
MGLTESLAAAMEDWRQPGKVTHEQPSLLRQRVFAIANGYPDGNDAAQLACDPMLLLACGRSPTDEQPLASQPRLSRFENAAGPRTLLAMAEALARTVPGEQQQQRTGRSPRLIRSDIDPTCGQQEFSAFSGFYGASCYLPLLVTVSFDHEPEKFLVAAWCQIALAVGATGG